MNSVQRLPLKNPNPIPMVRLLTLFLAILVLILEVDAQMKEDVYKLFKKRYDICHQPLERGHCGSAVEVFYYNYVTQKCEMFTYTRCGGNTNRFRSKMMCIEFCIIYRYLIPRRFF